MINSLNFDSPARADWTPGSVKLFAHGQHAFNAARDEKWNFAVCDNVLHRPSLSSADGYESNIRHHSRKYAKIRANTRKGADNKVPNDIIFLNGQGHPKLQVYKLTCSNFASFLRLIDVVASRLGRGLLDSPLFILEVVPHLLEFPASLPCDSEVGVGVRFPRAGQFDS